LRAFKGGPIGSDDAGIHRLVGGKANGAVGGLGYHRLQVHRPLRQEQVVDIGIPVGIEGRVVEHELHDLKEVVLKNALVRVVVREGWCRSRFRRLPKILGEPHGLDLFHGFEVVLEAIRFRRVRHHAEKGNGKIAGHLDDPVHSLDGPPVVPLRALGVIEHFRGFPEIALGRRERDVDVVVVGGDLQHHELRVEGRIGDDDWFAPKVHDRRDVERVVVGARDTFRGVVEESGGCEGSVPAGPGWVFFHHRALVDDLVHRDVLVGAALENANSSDLAQVFDQLGADGAEIANHINGENWVMWRDRQDHTIVTLPEPTA